MASTERISVLVTVEEKRRIAKKAKAAGLSRGAFMRRAAYCFPCTEDEMLEEMISQLNKTTAQASAAIDKALAFIEASNRRITCIERKSN